METTVKVRIGKDDFWFFGPGVCELLKNINTYGSVASAAEHMDLSYSKAWKMIKNSEKGFGISLVERSTGGKGGGKAVITEEAKKNIILFERLDEDTRKYAEKRFRKLFYENE